MLHLGACLLKTQSLGGLAIKDIETKGLISFLVKVTNFTKSRWYLYPPSTTSHRVVITRLLSFSALYLK